jgi:sigma-E factor negative regulatory protein RseA
MAVAAPPHAPVAVAQSGGTAAAEQVMIRDPRLDELLAAHKQFGGASALQMPAGFMRNATIEGPAR